MLVMFHSNLTFELITVSRNRKGIRALVRIQGSRGYVPPGNRIVFDRVLVAAAPIDTWNGMGLRLV